jgi:hypothetical protein
LLTMTSIWMGFAAIPHEVASGNLVLEGERPVASAIQKWFGLSSFAPQQREVA